MLSFTVKQSVISKTNPYNRAMIMKLSKLKKIIGKLQEVTYANKDGVYVSMLSDCILFAKRKFFKQYMYSDITSGLGNETNNLLG